jgi:cytochrome bd ubiquinol oxidase subunit II
VNAVWYAIVAAMLSLYVVLDGFDFGAGIVHLYVARTDEERREVLSAIGPFWNGNEVWLIAAGGALVCVFPRVYAAGFSGFYLPLTMVLWLLILRGISIEFRSKDENELWRTFWDSVFCLSSALMTVVLGVALGNVIRGVPLDASGYFDGALFTDFQPGKMPGVLDWYTTTVGIFALLVLAGHGALFLSWRAASAVRDRALAVAKLLWPLIFAFALLVTYLTHVIRPDLYLSLVSRPWTWSFALVMVASSVSVMWSTRQQHSLKAFMSSGCLILAILGATAAGMYPRMLISTIDSGFSITAINGAVPISALRMTLLWFLPAMLLVAAYLAITFRVFRNTTTSGDRANISY